MRDIDCIRARVAETRERNLRDRTRLLLVDLTLDSHQMDKSKDIGEKESS